MQNHYPLWKNLLIIATLALGVIYALPNLYGNYQGSRFCLEGFRIQ